MPGASIPMALTGSEAKSSLSAGLRDSFGRAIVDLRISVTDRCNYRCIYCRSGESSTAAAHELSWPEWRRLAEVFHALGIRKLRITGGEPLLRPGLEEFLASIADLGWADLALTTNGDKLAGRAEALRRAGLRRVTISLDSVEPEKFARITRVNGGLKRVLAGIEAAQAAGLEPVKINAVLLRGYNDDEIEAFAGFARQHRVVVRFIEFMPLEEGRLWTPEIVVPMTEILQRLERRYPLRELTRGISDTACRYGFADGAAGEIGIIAPVSRPFCGHCSRIRMTADGQLRTCLFSLREWDLRARLRAGASDRQLREAILRAVAHKEERHHIGEPGFQRPARTMVHIGG